MLQRPREILAVDDTKDESLFRAKILDHQRPNADPNATRGDGSDLIRPWRGPTRMPTAYLFPTRRRSVLTEAQRKWPALPSACRDRHRIPIHPCAHRLHEFGGGPDLALDETYIRKIEHMKNIYCWRLRRGRGPRRAPKFPASQVAHLQARGTPSLPRQHSDSETFLILRRPASAILLSAIAVTAQQGRCPATPT